MASTIRAATFCLSLLIFGYFLLFGVAAERTDSIDGLLRLPAPPPPNPMVRHRPKRDTQFYDKRKTPGDDAPIDDLMDYWAGASMGRVRFGYNPKPSDAVTNRLLAELERDPVKLASYLDILPDNEKVIAFAKRVYDQNSTGPEANRYANEQIKQWLTYHSPYFAGNLEKIARKATETDEYVTHHEELLALAHVDYDRARAIADNFYSDSSRPVSQVLAKWVRYRHALETNSTSDIDRYRDELKAVVENKNAKAGMRDLAMDALFREKEWKGRDEWYRTLLSDESLAELRVNGEVYTGLATAVLFAPDDRFTAKMLELVRSDNPKLRNVAVRNLLAMLDRKNPDVIRALLPMLDDPKWIPGGENERDAVLTLTGAGNARETLLRALAQVEIPESVPALIRLLDELVPVQSYGPNAANVAAMRAANANVGPLMPVTAQDYRYRPLAIQALLKQRDPVAAPALRRILPEVEFHIRSTLILALIACKGFSTSQQLSAIEYAVKHSGDVIGSTTANTASNAMNAVANRPANSSPPFMKAGPVTDSDVSLMLGTTLISSGSVDDDLASALVERVQALDEKDRALADQLRGVLLKWGNAAATRLFLRDAQFNKASSEVLLRLIAQRKTIRESFSSELSDMRRGGPIGVGVGACIADDRYDQNSILDGKDVETQRALLACARLTRAALSLDAVESLLKGGGAQLATAAEAYLESEDSPRARAAVLARHPREVRIMGATTAFFPEGVNARNFDQHTNALFASMDGEPFNAGPWDLGHEMVRRETELRDEIKKEPTLLGVYSLNKNSVRIYKDKAIFSWDEDNSRYRERSLTREEFATLTSYLRDTRADEQPPFLGSGNEYNAGRELLMLTQAGGRRVFANGKEPDLFVGLEKIFTDLRMKPATLKYALSRDLPGLEVVLADDEINVETVWKNGPDLRVAVSLNSVRQKVKDEAKKFVEDAAQSSDAGDEDEKHNANAEAAYNEKLLRWMDEHAFNGYSWRKIIRNSDGGSAQQPAGVEMLPPTIDDARWTGEEWKARTSAVQVRANENGLLLTAAGRSTLLSKGSFVTPIITPNGRWVVVAGTVDDEDQRQLLRINLVTHRSFPVEDNDYYKAVAYIPTLNRVLLAPPWGYDDRGDSDWTRRSFVQDFPTGDFLLLDPETGKVEEAKGEFRPWAHQTFRPLQKVSGSSEYWASIVDPSKHTTEVGTYDVKTLAFRPVVRIPNMLFNSMEMWVDEAEHRVYFVYRGHLLSLPLRVPKQSAKPGSE